MFEERRELRIVTYMCPSHPVQLYEVILELLEQSLECYTTLQYESRVPGPFPDRPNPFSTNKIDLGKSVFMFLPTNFYTYLCSVGSMQMMPLI